MLSQGETEDQSLIDTALCGEKDNKPYLCSGDGTSANHVALGSGAIHAVASRTNLEIKPPLYCTVVWTAAWIDEQCFEGIFLVRDRDPEMCEDCICHHSLLLRLTYCTNLSLTEVR